MNIQKAMENHHAINGILSTISTGPFSIAMLVNGPVEIVDKIPLIAWVDLSIANYVSSPGRVNTSNDSHFPITNGHFPLLFVCSPGRVSLDSEVAAIFCRAPAMSLTASPPRLRSAMKC